jgi:hypothetical protein
LQGNKYDTNEQAAGKDVRLALVKDGKVIDTVETSTTPQIGFNSFDQRRFEKNGEEFRQIHLGNKVTKINYKKTSTAPKAEPAKTNEEQIAILRAEEQAELDSRIKGADKYRGKDGKVDKTKLTKKADIKAFDEVYAEYDKLISPLMETKPVPNQEVEATAKKLDDAIKNSPIEFIEEEGNVRMTGGDIESKVAAQRGDKKQNVKNPSTIPFLPKTINAIHLARNKKDKNSILKNGFDEKQASIDSPIPGVYFSSEDWSTMDRFGRAKENGLYVSVKNDGLVYFDDSNSFRNYLKENNLPYQGETLTQNQLDQLKAKGVKGILLREDFASQSRNELIVIDKSIIENISDKETPITSFPSSFSDSKSISEAYYKAKKDGSNPELVKAVDKLLGTKEAETQAEFTSKQESSASEEFDGTKKPSKIKMKSFDGKHGKGAFERMKNITDNFEDIMDGLSEKIKQDCL